MLKAKKLTLLMVPGKPKILTQQNQCSSDATSMSLASKLHTKVSIKDSLKVR